MVIRYSPAMDSARLSRNFFSGTMRRNSRLMMGLMMTGMAMTKLNVVILEAVFRPYMANR